MREEAGQALTERHIHTHLESTSSRANPVKIVERTLSSGTIPTTKENQSRGATHKVLIVLAYSLDEAFQNARRDGSFECIRAHPHPLDATCSCENTLVSVPEWS